MEDFATYILNEKDLIQKMLIVYYMSKKTNIFFDKSIILRTEIGRIFLNYANIDVDKNEVLTELLLCNCKKVDNPQKIGKLETYAKEGAEYLSTLGFSKKFCHTCEGLNRYIPAEPREKESDILELVDQFSGLILRRSEREAFTPQEALIILKERNLKNVENRYVEDFTLFVNEMENVYIKDTVEVPVIRKLAFLCEKEPDVKSYIAKLSSRYSDEIDKLMNINIKEKTEEVLYKDEERPSKAQKAVDKAKAVHKATHRFTREIKKSNNRVFAENKDNNAQRAFFDDETADRILHGGANFKEIIEEGRKQQEEERI